MFKEVARSQSLHLTNLQKAMRLRGVRLSQKEHLRIFAKHSRPRPQNKNPEMLQKSASFNPPAATGNYGLQKVSDYSARKKGLGSPRRGFCLFD
jgi:hypothetical protein